MRLLFPALALVLAGCVRMPVPGSLPAAVAPAARTTLAYGVAYEASATPTPAPAAEPAPDIAPLPLPVATYSVDVRRTPAGQLLAAIARDHGLDFEPQGDIDAPVSLNVHEKPLPELIERICEQAALRCRFDGQRLAAQLDTPFLRAYRVDYVNLSRDMSGAVATSTQIATSASAVGDAPQMGGGNTSLTRIETKAANHFWEALEASIRTLLDHDAPKPRCDTPPCAGNASAGFVVSHRETGILMVQASARQHHEVAEFIELVQGAARQQVMVEATIVEVTLGDDYRQGIDWKRLGSRATSVHPLGANGNSALQPTVSYLSDRLDIGLDWLETFGTLKVLSSPRLSVLNNQTAVLKVVEEIVYFLVDASTTEYASSEREKITATTKPQSVSVGLVMALTPQIGRDGAITLGVRPTISSISGYKDDPNPSLGAIPNRVPQIRTREIESVLRLSDGEIAVLGGLMEDKIDYDTGRIPLLGALPVLGELFTRRENSVRRTELVIFLRPRLIRHPGIAGDYAAERAALPQADFLRVAPAPGERNFRSANGIPAAPHLIRPDTP
ncbi:MAG: general secretion pathway protein GspD [Azoarcus sp.]|jgi:general secretion pathway protein D|nr:general secretion pathway protein GspD [Azoarcus sp.]